MQIFIHARKTILPLLLPHEKGAFGYIWNPFDYTDKATVFALVQL